MQEEMSACSTARTFSWWMGKDGRWSWWKQGAAARYGLSSPPTHPPTHPQFYSSVQQLVHQPTHPPTYSNSSTSSTQPPAWTPAKGQKASKENEERK